MAMVNNCDALVAVKSLPDILVLIKILSDKFHSQVTRAQAEETSIKYFISRNFSDFNLPQQKLESMVSNYVRAWNTAITFMNSKQAIL